ncbi:MAG: hypothetical protein AAFQ15_13540 [Pseudomonadota bacterium]
MTLEDFYFISQVVAAAALVVSLVFVGLQVRQGNKMAEEAAKQTQQANLIALNEMDLHVTEGIRLNYQAFGTDPMFLRSLPRALDNETDFSPEEWTQLYHYFANLVMSADMVKLASKRGLIEDDYWPRIQRGVVHLIRRPVFFEQWQGLQRSGYQTPEFHNDINALFREMYPDCGNPEYQGEPEESVGLMEGDTANA